MKLSLLIKNGFWATYGAIATRVLALLSNLLLAKLLLPSDFGVIGVAYIFWALVNLFTQDTVGSFLVYKGIEDKRYVNTAYTISLCIGLVLGLLLFAISPLAAKFFGVPDLVGILAIFAFSLVLSFAFSVYSGILTRRMQYRELANSNLIASGVRVFSTIIFALSGLSYWSFAIGDAAYWVTSCIILHHHCRLNFRFQIHKAARTEVLSYCLKATGNSLGYYVNANSDNFVVGKLLGTSSLGYYNFAYQLTMVLPTIVSQVIGQVWMSAFAQISDEQQQKKTLVNVVGQTAFLAAPVYGIFFLLTSEQVISLIFGEKWIPSVSLIPYLLIFAYFRLFNSLLSVMLSVKGRPDINAKVNLVVAPFAVGSFILGAVSGGVIGVSIAVALILGIIWTLYWWSITCHELNWNLVNFLNPAFLPVGITLISVLFSLTAPIVFKPFIFTIVYLIMARIFASKYLLQYQSLFGKAMSNLFLKNQR